MRNRIDVKLRDRALHHMVSAVKSAPFSDDPFPHFTTREFLPDDVYQQLLAGFPQEELYQEFSYEKHQSNGVSNRKRFCLTSESINRLDRDGRVFWFSLRNAFGSQALKNAVYKKLAPGLAYRYRIPQSQVVNLKGYALPELFRETEGYSIAPHPDTRKKVVTMQFALATDNSQEPLGTEFYKRSVNPLSWLREPCGFETVKRMSFLPNTVYAFSVLNTMGLKSWHGRSALQAQEGVRNSLLNIWYEKAEHANPELARECGLLQDLARVA